MTSDNRAIVFWLPPWAMLKGQLTASMQLHRLLQRADHQALETGEAARLARAFEVLPRKTSVAALTRQLDAGDAEGYTWLRADPANVRPDMASARLIACGDELGLSAQDTEALLRPLKPLFGDEGFPISAPVPSRWYLCLPSDVQLPTFAPPEAVYGDDLLAFMPEGAAGMRWRRLMSEAQIILHHHPINAARTRAGRLPVNSLWFWGAGRLPDHVQSALSLAVTDEPMIAALCQRAGVELKSRAVEFSASTASHENAGRADPAWGARILEEVRTAAGHILFDLRDLTTLETLDSRWVSPALEAVTQGHADELRLDFGDGLLLRWRASHRWRFWRRRLPA